MYVGSVSFYSDKSSFHHQSFQHTNTNFSEIVLDDKFEFLKRHKLLEKMQNFSPPISNFLDTIHPADLPSVLSEFSTAGRKHFNMGYRVKKAGSQDSILVYGQFYLGNTQNGNNVISAFISPAVLDQLDEDELAASSGIKDEPQIKEEKMEMGSSSTGGSPGGGSAGDGSPGRGSTSTNDSYSSFSEEVDLIGSYGNLLPENDHEILLALDHMFPSPSESDSEDYKGMPQLDIPGSFITCLNR